MGRTFLSAPDVGELETKYVTAALASGWAAPVGPDLDAFESEIAYQVGVPHAVALSSGTAALHLGLLGLGIGAGDVVLTATMTFAATANAISYTGAQPFFVDSEPTTGNVDVGLLIEAADRVRGSGRRIGAIVPVDLLGKCADLPALSALAADLEVPLLVDAAESMGARCADRPSGSYGDAAVLSFNGNKIITTSGGGMLLTRSAALAGRVRYLATQARQPVVHYEHTDIGYNYRLSNVLAALGRAQLERLPAILRRRRQIRQAYRKLFAEVAGVTIFGGSDDEQDNCWLTSILVDDVVTGWPAAELSRWLDRHDIESRPLWKPMHLQPVFAGCDRLVRGDAEWLFGHGLTLPSGSGMSDAKFEGVLATLRCFLDGR